IVLARPELLDRRPNWGGGRLNHLAIALEPLGSSATADLVRCLLDSEESDVIKLVSERSEGNPFYAGELARSYLDHGSLERLPDTVQATVLARLDLLPVQERRVLQLGSVFGRAFRASGVGALEPGLDQHVLELCENLADRDLIRPAEGDRYSFRHILIQEVAYGTLPRSERARLHAEAARWVESNAGQREVALAEILAFHYREAAVLYTALEPGSELTMLIREKAAQWLLRATDVAVAAGATPEAVRHLRATFDFVDPALRPRLHERIGDLTAGDSGLEEYRLALEGYEAAGAPADDQLRALAGMLMVSTRWSGSVGDRPSEQWMTDLRARGRALQRIAFEDRLGLYERLDAHSTVAWMSYLMGDLETADRDSAAMVARLMPGQAPYPALHLYAWRALTLFTLGRWTEATALFYRCVEAWHDAGSLAAGYGLRGFVVGLDIGRARGDMRLAGAATDAMESILARFPPGHYNHVWAAYIQGEKE